MKINRFLNPNFIVKWKYKIRRDLHEKKIHFYNGHVNDMSFSNYDIF